MRMTFFGSKINIPIIAIALFVSSCSGTKEPPKPVYPIPTQSQIEWQKLETYAFVHFGLNTFNDMEWGFGNTSPETFNPQELDCEQWVRTLKAAGMKAVILTAKHHDGFCLWPTETTEYNISKSPYKNGNGDMVKELSEACRKYGLKFGLYLSPWDRNNPEYGRDGYRETYHGQINELSGNYGPLFEFWFDGANGGDGYYGGTNEVRKIDANTYYDYERARDTILKRNPDAMIFGGTVPTIRWVGNEGGWAGCTDWCPTCKDKFDNYSYMHYGSSEGTEWLPAEVDVSIRPGWFYHAREDHQVKSLARLMDIYYNSVGHNANLLLNFPVGLSGKIHPKDSTIIMEWHNALLEDFKDNLLKNAKAMADNVRGRRFSVSNLNDDKWDTYWATEDGITEGKVTFNFSKPTKLNRVVLQEYIPLGQRVSKFHLEGQNGKQHVEIISLDSTTTIGYKRIVRFKTVEVDKLVVCFDEAKGPLCVNNIEAYFAPALLTEPVIYRDFSNNVYITASDVDAAVYYTTDGSEPDLSSEIYRGAFELDGKGILKAVSVDTLTNNFSALSVKEFDLPYNHFDVKKPVDGVVRLFDGHGYSTVSLPLNDAVICLEFKEEQNISGFRMLPAQGRDATGHATNYRFYVDNKLICEGVFDNIDNNPVEQVVEFAPVTGKRVKFVAERKVPKSSYIQIGEFSVITE